MVVMKEPQTPDTPPPPAPARRPGGRSARVRAAVHKAVTELIAERGYGAFAVADVATRAGVADSSIYRRWGNLEALLMDAVVSRLTEQSPVPDTGSLRTDLRTFAAKVAEDVTGPDGLALLRTVLVALAGGPDGESTRDRFLAVRSEQLQSMLERARARGEDAPDVLDVLDGVLAPIYLRVLFGVVPLAPEYVEGLADSTLARRSG